jgi:hypothetical protein
MLTMKINMQHGHGSKHKNKTKMNGTILKKEFTMIMLNKRKYTKPKKPKTWSHKSNLNSWVLKPDKISTPKEETKNTPNGKKTNLSAPVFTESQPLTTIKMMNLKTESF